MPFSPEDLDKLLNWLETRPDLQRRLWRALLRREALDALRQALAAEPELRRRLLQLLLTENLLHLPALVADLVETQRESAAQQRATVQHLAQLARRVDQLAEAQLRTEQRLEQLIQRLDQQEQRVSQDFQHIKDRQVMEVLRERPGWFRPFLHNPAVLSPSEVDALLLQLVERRQLSQTDYQELLHADLFVRGQHRGHGQLSGR